LDFLGLPPYVHLIGVLSCGFSSSESEGGGVYAARDGVAGWESSSSVHCRFRFMDGEEAAEKSITVHIAVSIGVTIGKWTSGEWTGFRRCRTSTWPLIGIANSNIAEQIGRVFVQNLGKWYRRHVLIIGVEPSSLRTSNVGCVMSKSKFGTSMTCDPE
jgi:hypothetical protein